MFYTQKLRNYVVNRKKNGKMFGNVENYEEQIKFSFNDIYLHIFIEKITSHFHQ